MLKSFKIGFWFLIPFIFISNSDIEPMELANDNQGALAVHASGVFQELLNGKVTFEMSKDSNSQDTPYSSISLKFVKEGENEEHVMGFIIKEPYSSKNVTIGEYKFSKNVQGLLNNFEGVFGYADVKSSGEEPWFAKKGKLVITQMDAGNLRGYLNVRFKDINSNELFVKGNFHAVNLIGK